MTSTPNFYVVKKYDTLLKIAEDHATTVQALCQINGIQNPDKIKVGQKIALAKEKVCGVEFQLLDKDCNPLRDTSVKIEYGKKEIVSNTGKTGIPETVFTDSPMDVVSIYIQRIGGDWKKLASTTSDWGNKLVTLISPKIKLTLKTQPHPQDQHGRALPDRLTEKPDKLAVPTLPEKAVATGKIQSPLSEKNKNTGIKSLESTDAAGMPHAKVTNDQSDLPFLLLYKGGRVSEADWAELAKDLSCEVNAVKAVTQVEAGGKGGFDSKNRPIILFERHQFSKYSARKFDHDYPFISSKTAYLRIRGNDRKIIPDRKKEFDELKEKNAVANSNYYPPDSNTNYIRLSKAYLLDKTAALKSASWGMFQVMGFNFASCGFASVDEFVDAMATSEKEQVKAFARFIKSNKKLTEAIKDKDWLTFAINYNGAQQEHYDEQIKKAYENLGKK